ncbi:hypothetical protein Gorai_021493 [Gossypium raimondii]|uniref:Uncharacterized protein n=1 Tax=Gossypium raimondii TaxID=29730 RepID=A0A7J8NQF1_GOSRA|nr:hypothetical protein [Gossypium raimondii]
MKSSRYLIVGQKSMLLFQNLHHTEHKVLLLALI